MTLHTVRHCARLCSTIDQIRNAIEATYNTLTVHKLTLFHVYVVHKIPWAILTCKVCHTDLVFGV